MELSKSKQAEYLSKQLEELEMLQSIYPSPGEFRVDDRSVISDARNFVAACGDTGVILKRISFMVRVDCSEGVFSATCELPLNYPDEPPDIFIRADVLHRDVQRCLNEDLEEYIMETERGEACIFNALQWVQDNIAEYKTQRKEEVTTPRLVPMEEQGRSDGFTRLWILSHHIYSKFKRRDILDWSADMKLTGFCLPGKPGIVCVEGATSDAEEFWNRLRRLNWKKISCKHREDFPLQDNEWQPKTLEERRMGPCFSTFEELNFTARGFGTGRDYHMDLGMFQKYLQERGMKDIFKVLLGLEGKAATS